MASSALTSTSTGLDSIASLLPPSLKPHLQTTLLHLDATLSALSSRTGLPRTTTLLLTLLSALALPLAMWSYRAKRPTLSPWASMNQGRTPDVTDDDYSYITSQDLDSRSVPRTAANRDPGPAQDDVLVLKYRNQIEEARFPAYSIGDGKLRVHDIRDRVGIMLDLPESQTRRIRLFYKGRQLKEPGALARDYGIKNNSEILAMLREDHPAEDPHHHHQQRHRRPVAHGSEEDVAAAEEASSYGGSSAGADAQGTKRRKSRRSKKKTSHGGGAPTSPRPGSTTSAASTSPSTVSPQREELLDRLDEIEAYYETELKGLCHAFMRDPPRDKGKREDEHRRLSETVLQHIILKLDGVEPDGDEVVRARRKALVKKMQGVLSSLDAAKNRA